jgi:hypothetical protein
MSPRSFHKINTKDSARLSGHFFGGYKPFLPTQRFAIIKKTCNQNMNKGSAL